MRKSMLFLILVLVCGCSLVSSSLSVSAAGDDETSSSEVVQPLADFFQRLDSRLSQIESRLSNIEQRVGEKEEKPLLKKDVGDFPITVSGKMKREPNAFVLMLESRLPVTLRMEFYKKGHICHVSAVMCDHLVQSGYAKYVGNTPNVTVEILDGKKFNAAHHTRLSTGDYRQIDWEAANRLIEQGVVKLIMPRY